MKTFVVKYANWKWNEVDKRIATEEEKLEWNKKISKTVWACEQGLITIDEAMKSIAEI